MWEIFQYEYVIRGLAASAMVGLMCGVLGCFIFLRNMALIGDALSHSILPGVVVGFMVAGHSVFAFFIGSLLAGLISALLITWIQMNVKSKDDAAIGIVFTAMFSLGILGISWLTKQEGVHLDMKDFLFGNVLGISNQDLWLTGLITLYVIVCITALYRFFFITTFDAQVARTMGISIQAVHYFLMLLLSFAVVASLQSVGVILVVGMLIIPASTSFLLTNRLSNMIIIAALLGVLATTCGFILAVIIESTPGPLMILTAVGLYVLAIFFAPQRGLIIKYFTAIRAKRKVVLDDLLKLIVKLRDKGQLSRTELQNHHPKQKLINMLDQLVANGDLSYDGKDYDLTPGGLQKAVQLIRAHRVWESYMVEHLGLNKDQVHEDAESLEHFLTPNLVDEIQADMGRPLTDPHGSIIPQNPGSLKQDTLAHLKPGQQAVIFTQQDSEHIMADLWKAGITPNVPIIISDQTDEGTILKLGDEQVMISKEISANTRVFCLSE